MSNFHSPDTFAAGRPLRLLIIGAGKMGQAHAAAFKTVRDVELVGVVSQGGESARQLAARYDIPRWGTSWQALAEETGADACVVAVSHLQNEKLTAEVIDYGLHTLAEKPVSLDPGRIRSLAESARQKGVIAMAAMNRRFYPSVTAALEMVRFQGPLCGITVIAPDPVSPYRASRKYNPSVYDNWTEMNTLHAIDLLRLAGGEVEALSGYVQRSPSGEERSIVATLRFQSGLLGSFISYGSHSGQWEVRLHGDGVEARLLPLEEGTMRIGNAAPIPLPRSAEQGGLKPGLPGQARAFVESVRELGAVAPPGSDFFDHACTMALVQQLVGLPETTPAAGSHL